MEKMFQNSLGETECHPGLNLLTLLKIFKFKRSCQKFILLYSCIRNTDNFLFKSRVKDLT